MTWVKMSEYYITCALLACFWLYAIWVIALSFMLFIQLTDNEYHHQSWTAYSMLPSPFLVALDTVVIVLCVAPHVVNPQYLSSNSWALIVLGAESDTGEATPRLPTQIICGWLQIWNGVRFIAPPLIIPPSPQNTCIIAVAFLLTLSSATFASQTVTLCIHLRPFPALLFTLFVIQENVSLHWNEIKGKK